MELALLQGRRNAPHHARQQVMCISMHRARVAEPADAAGLNPAGPSTRVGSTPTARTIAHHVCDDGYPLQSGGVAQRQSDKDSLMHTPRGDTAHRAGRRGFLHRPSYTISAGDPWAV